MSIFQQCRTSLSYAQNKNTFKVDLEEDLVVPVVEDEAVVVDHAVVVLDGEIKEDMELHHGIKEDTVENGIKDMVADMKGVMMMDMEVRLLFQGCILCTYK